MPILMLPSGRMPRRFATYRLLNQVRSSLSGLNQSRAQHASLFSVGALASVGAFALVLAGCASAPPPDGAMNQAHSQLQAARNAGAAEYAPADLRDAQDRFQQAQAAFADRQYDVAASLADEASADAELARAKGRLGAARAQIQDKTSVNNQLRQQMEAAHPIDGSSVSVPASGFAPASSDPDDAPTEMPAPPSSAISPGPSGQGFQTLPASSPAPSEPASSDDQNTLDRNQGGRP